MSAPGTLIVGAGQGGLELAAALRAAGDTGPITLVGAEEHAPYQRPPLSKAFLRGEAGAADLLLRDDSWLKANGITVLRGESVEAVNRNPDGSGTATTCTGRSLGFTVLALATGARPRTLPGDGEAPAGVHYLRGIDDARALARELVAGANLVVIGGGFIGLEVAATARAAGCNTTVLEASDRLIGRAVCPETSAFYRGSLESRGTAVHTSVAVGGFTREAGKVTGVLVAGQDGTATVVPADVVLVGIGVVPETGLAETLGLEVANGIVVDSAMLASDGMTVAIGDVANMPLPGGARGQISRVRLESVPNTIEQARIAAATLTGRAAVYEAVPWFWSDQGEVKLQIAGLSHGYDSTVLRGDPATGKFSVLYLREGLVIAADCINNPRDFAAVRSALRSGPVAAGDAADVLVALKEALRPVPVS